MINGHLRHLLFQGQTVLPTSGRAFPDQLWDIRIGATYLHIFDNNWLFGANINLGSASDKPFNSGREFVMGTMAFLQTKAHNDRDAWMFSLFYSPVGELNFPLPGIAYLYRPDETLQINIGLPFSVNWIPAPDWTVNLFYVPVRNVRSRVTWQAVKELSLYGGFEWGYFLADRSDRNERLQYFEKRLLTGAVWNITDKWRLDFQTGYAFDRFFFAGRGFEDRNTDRVALASGAYFELRLSWNIR
jgi:hypothetical protein